MGAILRFLGSRRFLQSPGWLPHSPTAAPATLFASLWPAEDGSKSSAAWTLVNRDTKNAHSGAAINVTMVPPAGVVWHYYDLYHGTELPAPTGGAIALDLEISGYGAVLATPNTSATDAELAAFLAKMKAMTATPLQSLSNVWQYEQQWRVPVAPAPAPAAAAADDEAPAPAPAPAGMVSIPGGKMRFAVSGIEIEGSGANINNNPEGVDFQYEWDPLPQRFHVQWLTVKPFYMDKHPVTQGQFAAYLQGSGKAALQESLADPYHYLWNWDWSDKAQPKPHPGNESMPVTYVGLDEARGYCKSLGKRLPREEEWQFSAHGPNSTQKFPWGSLANASLMPKQVSGSTIPGPAPVGSYSPAGDSAYGVADLLGNVWQYTDEHQDDHTRSVCLRGGSNYRPAGSHWYFPNQADLLTHEKYFLMSAAYERAGTIGFRCAQDLPVAEQETCTDALCGSFSAPDAFADLTGGGGDQWTAWGVSGTDAINSAGGTSSISALSGGKVSLAKCAGHGAPSTVDSAGQQVAFSWTNGPTSNATAANTTAPGVCQVNGDGVTFTVKPGKAGTHTLSLYAGTQHASHNITATLTDGGKVSAFTEELTAVAADMTNHLWINIRWELSFKTSASAVLTVHLSAPRSNGHYAAPALPPAPPPCASALCGSVESQPGSVDLSAVGSLDWAHFGDKKATQTIAGKPLQYVAAGAAVPSDPKDKTLFSLAGGATLIGSQTAGMTDLRSGNANDKATITLTSHIEGNGHNIEGFGMSFRYIAGYGCAGTAKPCPGAPIVTVVLVDATTMSDLATVWTSPPLGNYSYGQFHGYSPPVVVDVHGLNVSNANPVLIQLRIANNKRNLQMQLAPKTGLNATVSWTKQTFSQNASGCDASCVQATLTTNKCGVASPWIQPVTVLGGAAVGSDNGLSLGSPRPGFLFTDGFQTAFTDTPSTGALWARGGGLGSTISIPASSGAVVVRFYVGADGGGATFSASLSGDSYNATLPGKQTQFSVVALAIPASTQTRSLQASLVPSGDNASSIVLLGAVAVEGTAPHTSAVEAAPTRKCAAAPGGASRTLMLQAATLT